MPTQAKQEPQTPLYNEYGSAKLEEGIEGEPAKRISILKLLLISMPRMAINMAWAAQWAALGPYLGTMLPKFAVQLTQIVGPTSGILVGPTVGVQSDRCTSRFGRRRPFLAIAGALSIICWILMGYTREMGEGLGDYGTGAPGVPTSRKWTSFFTVFFYIWMDVTVNVVQTPSFLLVADMAGDRQTTGAALAQGWTTLGSIMVSDYIEIWGPAHLTLHWFLGMLSAVMFICVGVVCVFVKEEPLDPSLVEKKSALRGIGEAFYSIYTGLRSLPYVLIVYSFIYFCVSYGFTAYNGNKGQFFGIVVKDGDPVSADRCAPNCTEAQENFNDGVRIASGSTDLIGSAVGYVYSWALPLLVLKFGAKWGSLSRSFLRPASSSWLSPRSSHSMSSSSSSRQSRRVRCMPCSFRSLSTSSATRLTLASTSVRSTRPTASASCSTSRSALQSSRPRWATSSRSCSEALCRRSASSSRSSSRSR